MKLSILDNFQSTRNLSRKLLRL